MSDRSVSRGSSRSSSSRSVRGGIISNGSNVSVVDSPSRRIDGSSSYDFWSDERKAWERHDRLDTLKGVGSVALGALTGGALTGKLGALKSIFTHIGSKLGLGALLGSKMSNNDQVLSSLYGSAYTPASGSNSGLWTWLQSLFGGSSMSGNSGFIGNLLSSLVGYGNQYLSSIFNMQNMKELIDYQNEYNTPANQMERFEEAGLNPNLIYGLGSNGNQPSSGSIAPVDFDTSRRENQLARFSMQIQQKQFEADLGLKQAQMNLLNSQADGQGISNALNSATFETQIQQMSANLKLTIQNYDNAIAEKRNLIANATNTEIRNEYERQLKDLEVAKSGLEKDLLELQSTWQPWLYGFDIFQKGATGIGSLGIGASSFGKLFKNAPKWNKSVSPYEFGDMISNYGF